MQMYQKKIGDYYLQKEIGRGAFATVYRAMRESDKQLFAIKQINKNQIGLDKQIDKEIEILKCLQHPNIVSLKDIKQTQNNWYLVFEYCENGELDHYIQQYFKSPHTKPHLPEAIAQKIIYQIAEAFKLIREKKIVHRDLKLQNILVTKDFDIKVADFGLARIFEADEAMQSFCGTYVTMAPEIHKKQSYDERCDIWSLGVIMYKMLLGEYPFWPNKGSRDGFIDLILKQKVKFDSTISISNEIKELISSMLVVDVDQRQL